MEISDQWKIDLKAKEEKLQFFNSGTAEKPAAPGDKWEIPNFLTQIDAEWARVLIDVYDHPMSFPGSVSPQMGNFLRALIINIAPRNVIEIGSFIGVSSLWIASAMAEYKRRDTLYCIDLFPSHTYNPWCPGITLMDPFYFMSKNMQVCGFQDHVTIHKGNSIQLLPSIAQNIGDSIDFVMIDGDHSIEGCIKDFELVAPYVATGGYILFHDVFPDYCGVEGPAYALLDKVIPSDKYEVCQIYTAPLNFGFALVRKIA